MTIDETIASQLTRLSDALDDQISALAEKGVAATGHGEEDIGDDIRSIEQPFIVTLSWDDQEMKWLPDCTIGDIRGAYAAGRDIAIEVDSEAVLGYVQVSGEYIEYTGDYTYTVAVTNTLSQTIERVDYRFNEFGASVTDFQTTYFASSCDADPSEVAAGSVFITDTGFETGTAPRRDDTDLAVNGRTVSVPKGFYEDNESKSVEQGSAGTPVATKGQVSNHTVEVTPKVTNVGGYIAGGEETGNPVNVTAAELVSGTKQISANGTDIDVTNYQKVDVAVPGGGGNNFIVNLSYNSQQQKWLPDCTFAEAYDAYDSGKDIAFETAMSDYVPVFWEYDDDNNFFFYGVFIFEEHYSPIYSQDYTMILYHWTSEGVEIYDSGSKFYSTYTADALPADVTAGKYFFNADGMQVGTNQGGGGSSKEKYIYDGLASRTANSYGSTSAKVTVTKAGTYNISYVAIRGSSTGTMGTNLHIGSTAGTNQQTWNNGTYGQYVHLTNQQISANTDVTIYATSGSTSRTIYVGMLIVEEV